MKLASLGFSRAYFFNSAPAISATGTESIEIHNVRGDLLWQTGSDNAIRQPRDAATSGVYIVTARVGGVEEMQRVVYVR